MAQVEQEKECINTLISHCHSTCHAIEERLTTIRVPPTPPSASLEKAPETTPENLMEALGSDREALVGLLTRLRVMEDHVAAIQDTLKSLV